MRKSNVALRLPPHLLDEARRVAKEEGIALNQLISTSVAEKLSALRTAEFFRERAGRADVSKALGILARAGRGRPPVPGDEIDGGGS
jgi:hypothetical protein